MGVYLHRRLLQRLRQDGLSLDEARLSLLPGVVIHDRLCGLLGCSATPEECAKFGVCMPAIKSVCCVSLSFEAGNGMTLKMRKPSS